MAEEMRVPPVLWAQRADKIFLTITIEDLQDPTIKLEEKQLYFRGKGGVDNKNYEVTIEFHDDIDVSQSKYVVNARNIPMVIFKKESTSTFWPRLLKTKTKQHWLKTDFDKWVDEDDDSDLEAGPEGGMGGMPGMGGMGGMPGMGGMGGMGGDNNFEDMMKQMGNFSTADGSDEMGEDEEEADSDDEDLPDLS